MTSVSITMSSVWERDRHTPEGEGPPRRYWASHCPQRTRKILMVFLVSSFFLQTTLVYLDPSDARPLSPLAAEGRHVWLEHNCQSCHQLYGFGGFLGPDLTNASPRLAPGRLQTVVTRGVGLMPVFPLSSAEIGALGEFLAAMDETGQGQAKLRTEDSREDDPARAFRQIEEELARGNPEDVRRYQVYRESGCELCHVPFRESLTGTPDITDVFDRLPAEEVEGVLAAGRGQMPAPELSSDERESILGFLLWLSEHREALLQQPGASAPGSGGRGIWSTLPWWEYR